MSNECQRIITLHAPAEIRSILQIKENISIRRQTLKYAGRGMVAVHFLPELQYPGRSVQVKLSTNLQYLMEISSISNEGSDTLSNHVRFG